MKRFLLILGLIACGLFSARGDGSVSSIAHTTSGTVPRGCRGLTFVSTATFSGTIGGSYAVTTTAVNFTVPFYPEFKGDVLGAVPYTVTAGTLYTIEVR